ncbi:MAG: hypothetical protein DMF03_10485 [Verrucomicrobia bacterium]|nr:MAG: hypothetical protein DMF03_10485 [Verrucomicrobiota bacterium]
MTVRAFARQRSATALVAISVALVAANSSAADDWSATLSRDPRGSFPDLRPLHATYAFSWSGITAAMADVWFHRGDEGSFVLEGKGRTVGLARVLWRFDVNYRSVAHAQTLRPIEVHQTENVRSKRIETNLKFFDAGVTSTRTETNRTKSSSKNFALENLNDLHSALLYLRSQPLRDRSVFRLAVYPANSAYVATVTVIGHERVKVHAGTYSAIKLDLRLQRINKKNQLEPHRKFKRATAWVSDDNDRLLLRVEAQIFVGTIMTEIQSVRFDQPIAAIF